MQRQRLRRAEPLGRSDDHGPTPRRSISATRWVAGTLGAAAGVYAACVGWTWWRYGKTSRADRKPSDVLLDRFMPEFDVIERHDVPVAAPADITLAAAAEQDLMRLPVIQAIFRMRARALGGNSAPPPPEHGLLAQVRALGWGVLAEVPDREIVLGAVTKPWEAQVTFHAVEPSAFAAYNEPGFVKIAWTLRADPIGPGASLFRTETRAVATDNESRRRFRNYWAFVMPGTWLIRRLSLGPLKREAERRAAPKTKASSERSEPGSP